MQVWEGVRGEESHGMYCQGAGGRGDTCIVECVVAKSSRSAVCMSGIQHHVFEAVALVAQWRILLGKQVVKSTFDMV